MSGGTEQRERLPSALDSDYFRVDETTFEQLAAASAQLAAHLRFHEAGEHGGALSPPGATWAMLFRADELLAMATMLQYDPQPVQDALFDDFGATTSTRLASETIRLASVIDRWLQTLRAIDAPGARTLAAAIAALIEKQLAGELQWVARHALAPGWRGDIKGYELQRLDAAWFDARASAPPERGRSERDGLRSRFFAFKDGIARIQRLVREQIAASRNSQRHDPAAGLLVAFLELFGTVQGRINQFTARHTDFYYHDVLDMRPRRAQADRVHLVCEPVAGTQLEVVVARGTAFAAGFGDDRKPVEFLAETDLAITDVKVAALRTVRLEAANLVLGDDRTVYPVKRVRVDAPTPAADAQAGAAQRYWPLFGGAQAHGTETASDGELGLAVASPVLWLKEGQRDISVRLVFRPLQTPGHEASELWSRMGDADSRVRWQLERALPELFAISLTTATGWYEATEAFVSRPDDAAGAASDCLEVTVRLGPEAPAISGCTAALHGAQWSTDHPVMRIRVRQQAALCAYSLLENKELLEVQVDVRVQGARDVTLGNNAGRLDPSKPFMPFGPLPAKGSYLVFGSAEAARKPLTSLRLHVDWSGLPQELGGFPEYYDGYDSEFTNAGFRGAVSVLQDGEWRTAPDGSATGQSIFTHGPGGRLEGSSVIEVSPTALRGHFKPSYVGANGFAYDLASRNGFFRLELRKPDAAFGHAEYPQVLTRIVSANARRKRPVPLPHPPYTPTIERATLDYEAQTRIHLHQQNAAAPGGVGASKVFHLHPFGVEQLQWMGRATPITLLPAWPQDGNLYIGLSGEQIQGGLNLLFELRSESAVPMARRRAKLSWAYLASNRWCELATAQVLGDSTDGFLTSGIVRLDIPATIDRNNTAMPGHLYWLRLSADADFDAFAGLYSVRAQALSAHRSGASPMPLEYTVLPAGSVTGPVASIPGLARVTQVGNSFGMRPEESVQQLRVRTGERLKHKNRALLPWDYERLVLERFPAVFKVRCFPNLRSPDARRSPGDVLVVVVPQLGSVDQLKNVRGPRLNAVELHRIADYLRALAPPFSRIEVRNASYELIQVRCAIEWAPGAHAGLGIRRLNQVLFDHLSPWNDNGYRADFEWTIRPEDLEARIRELDFVRGVSQVSLLHVASSDDNVFSLGDTARPGVPPAHFTNGPVHHRWPWSIAVPMRRHLIGSIEATGTTPGPVPTGIDRLEIGNTFVVGAAR